MNLLKLIDKIALLIVGKKRHVTNHRVCSVCKDRIRRDHKWHFVKGKPQHKDCNNPKLILDKNNQLDIFKEVGND